jgi:hypothetical protein
MGNQAGPSNRDAKRRETLGWPALTGALGGSFLGANNLAAAGCAVDDAGLKTANTVTHVNPPHCRRGKAVQLMHNFDA